MNRKIYRELAKKHGVTAAEVRRDMQSALNAAYENSARTPRNYTGAKRRPARRRRSHPGGMDPLRRP